VISNAHFIIDVFLLNSPHLFRFSNRIMDNIIDEIGSFVYHTWCIFGHAPVDENLGQLVELLLPHVVTFGQNLFGVSNNFGQIQEIVIDGIWVACASNNSLLSQLKTGKIGAHFRHTGFEFCFND